MLFDVNNVSLLGEPGDMVLLLELLTILLHEDVVAVAVVDVVDFGLDSRKMPSIPLLDCDDNGGRSPIFGLFISLHSSTAPPPPKCVLTPIPSSLSLLFLTGRGCSKLPILDTP